MIPMSCTSWNRRSLSSAGVHHLIRLIWPTFYCFDPSLTQHINSPITQPLNVPRNSLKLYSNLRFFFLPKHNEVVLLPLLANFSRAKPSSPPSLQRLYGLCGYQRRIYILTRAAQWQKQDMSFWKFYVRKFFLEKTSSFSFDRHASEFYVLPSSYLFKYSCAIELFVEW